MSDIAKVVYEIIVWLFLIYSSGIITIYTWIALFSYGAVLRYKHGNVFTDYSIIATNPNVPSFSLIAPAYNEGKTIVENVRSLLSIYYYKLEIIIVNDGSKDDSMDRLIKAYDLEPVSYIIAGTLDTQEVKQVYKSKNPAFRKLIVVDKKNGGKADALNVGINISKSDYIVCIDVDCIIEQDAILKLAKPFMEQTDRRLIACGGVIRLANNCKIENGKVLEVNLPRTWLGRSQALEYIRAFVLGRMAWSRASGLILISGAFGAFDKEIVLACGGYDSKTVGEDMELVVRMRRYMKERELPHQVINIPDPLCWTEVPENKEVLKKQRNRWMRGTMETLWKHRKLMFNPKYGKLGMLSLPYWFFFEFMGPFVEVFGYIIFWIFLFMGILDWSFFLALFSLVIFSSVLYSIYAILVDLVSHQVYSKRKDITKLILTAVIEPFFFHPLVVWSGVRGMVDYFRKKSGWGDMTRQGFSQDKEERFMDRAIGASKTILMGFSPIASFYLIMVGLLSIAEYFLFKTNNEEFAGLISFFTLLGNNFLLGFSFLLLIVVVYSIFTVLHDTAGRWASQILVCIALLVQGVAALYFYESRNLLGADLFFYTFDELKGILQASGMLRWINLVTLSIAILTILFALRFISKRFNGSYRIAMVLLSVAVISLGYLTAVGDFHSAVKDDYLSTAQKSKIAYFFKSNTDLMVDKIKEHWIETTPTATYGNISSSYPFLDQEQTKDILGPYLNKAQQPPNLVLIIVEGLGNAYSNPNGYIGDFTPFLSSLKDSSLVWDNTLSSSGRTFSVLPTLLGSLPFGASGFLELKDYPNHFNLVNVLSHNHFRTGFFYGGDASFDFMAKYLRWSNVDTLMDQYSLPNRYRLLPSGSGGSWGFEDQAVLDQLASISPLDNVPYFHIALTLSTHNPFLINDAEKYTRIFEQRIQDPRLTKEQKRIALENRKQLISVLNADDALRGFFEKYNKREDFKRTLFVITGDHSMPEIPLQSKIDRYHVPLILYSPLLKTHKTFSHVVSHFDFAPSILAYYRENYLLDVPDKIAWIGKGVDVGVQKQSLGVPIMQSKSQMIDFVYGDIHLHDQNVFRINGKLEENAARRNDVSSAVEERFSRFLTLNRQFLTTLKLIPDTVYEDFFKN